MLLEEFDVEKYERSLRAEGREEGREEGYEAGHSAGDAQRLIRSVDEIMKRLYLTLPQACSLIGVSVEEYRQGKSIC